MQCAFVSFVCFTNSFSDYLIEKVDFKGKVIKDIMGQSQETLPWKGRWLERISLQFQDC